MATSGTATISADDTYVDVTHTYGDDDFIVQIEPQDDLGGRSFWVTDKTATNFRINISSSDTEDHDFAWAIVVGAQEETTPSTNYYAVLANALQEGGVSFNQLGYSSQSVLENKVTRMMLEASRLIDRECNVPDNFFNGGATVTKYLSGKPFDVSNLATHRAQVYDQWRKTYVLNFTPIISVTSVSINSAAIGETASWTTTTSYIVNSESGKLVFSSSSAPNEGTDNIKVVYTAGYETVPPVIEMACEQLVGNALKKAVKNLLNAYYRFGGKGQPIEVQPVVEMTPDIKMMLKPYKRMN